MEAPGCSPQWRRCSSQSNRRSGEALRDSAQKSVTVAPFLRLLTERQYRVRQPLVTAQHTSTLKKTHTETCTQQLHCDVRTEEMSPRSTDVQPPPHSVHSLPGSRSRTSPLLGRAPPSSVLQVQRLKTPVRPQLNSTVLYPIYTPRSVHKRTHNDPEQSNTFRDHYWACAIPRHPPPTSSGGHLHQDYEALLDYTYPLRPGLSPERDRPQPGELTPIHCTLQDSGIEPDHLSPGQSELLLSFSETEQAEGRCMGQRSSETPRVLSLDTLDWCKQENTMAADPWCSPSAALISVPLDRGDWGVSEEDMEFRPLPEQLQQLQQFSAQVREMATRLDSAHWDPSVFSHPVGQDPPHTGEGGHYSANMAALRTEDSLRTDVSLTLDDLRRLEQTDSLLEHINVFCCDLEQLIHSLYITSQKIKQLAPPTVDIHSVKSSLAQYQCFQREVNSHLPLTSGVLRTGQLLLSCLQTTSPVLRDALLLIQNQSTLLERHTERFFSSILSAMDTLTQPKAAPDPNTEDPRGESGAGTQERSGVEEQRALKVQADRL